MNINIEKIYKQDQKDRKTLSGDNYKEVIKNDALRRKAVLSLLKEDMIKTGKELFMAAMIFQHGQTVGDYRKAIKLASQSAEAGYKKGKYLEALAIDRSLVVSGKKQKFGTQYFKKNSRSKFVLCPVNPKTTDEERKRYGLPTLEKLSKQMDVLNGESK